MGPAEINGVLGETSCFPRAERMGGDVAAFAVFPALPRASPARRHRRGCPSDQKSFFESNSSVTGPSFTSATFMSARKTPSPTFTPWARHAAQKAW